MGEKEKIVLLWLRQDLRIEDHPALEEAIRFANEEKIPVFALYIWNTEFRGEWKIGSASLIWLYHSLKEMSTRLGEMGISLLVKKGKAAAVFQALLEERDVQAVFWSRLYDRFSIERDSEIKSTLKELGIRVMSFNSSLLFEPWTICNKEGRPYQVFTPFWKACLSSGAILEPVIHTLKVAQRTFETSSLDDLGLLPEGAWVKDVESHISPGSIAAEGKMEHFLSQGAKEYLELRDRPDLLGTSQLSAHLHFGEISPRILWKRFQGFEPFLRQLGWREFAHHLLYHFPETDSLPLKKEWQKFPWRTDLEQLKRWQKGETGFPIIDAGMRQLWKTGWMHNRVRMIVGSFLVKDLRISWLSGAKWFWDTLVDADLANNTLGWQWVGGCGADAAPYFRIFNPILQGEKFDPEGHYVKKWLPVLERIEPKYIHKPWELSQSELAKRGVILGKNYPFPIVDHAEAKKEADFAYSSFRGGLS